MVRNYFTYQKGANRWREWEQGRVVSNQLWANHCPKGFSYVVCLTATSKIRIIILNFFFSDEESEVQRD